jgi:hypothetical protein
LRNDIQDSNGLYVFIYANYASTNPKGTVYFSDMCLQKGCLPK